MDVLRALAGNEIGDPAKYAKVIFDLSRANELPHHLILGSDALSAIRAAEAAREQATTAWEPITRSTDRAGASLKFLADLPPH